MPAESKAQDDGPAFLNLPQAPAAGETDEAERRPGREVRSRMAQNREPGQIQDQAKRRAKPAKTSDPPREISAGFDGPFKAASPADLELDRPRTDEKRVRAQAPAAGAGGAAGCARSPRTNRRARRWTCFRSENSRSP